ncbi:hypothetical protein [Paludibacterium purpuratum]|uniref:Putative amino acid dehydrogenase n=1 Tax=Paludibacterium purpuratum TaxID=1144873 RepID=A0A4R7B9H7_9NEIS|nr:hypothetical protein [Paludibacterium purpuratum]TDR81550.1 putative amino acid dehydrogenase [Paludibacterium purpuratum]
MTTEAEILNLIENGPTRPFFGPDAQALWLREGKAKEGGAGLDVVLLTHPRDEQDLARMFPWAERLRREEIVELMPHLKPVWGEMIQTDKINVGILFLPLLAADILDPRKRAACRHMLEYDALDAIAQMHGRFVCLGGLTGALSQYGRRLIARADSLGMQVTTGHALTAVSIVQQYNKALAEIGRSGDEVVLAIVGVGSVGGGVAKLLCHSAHRVKPARVILIDTRQQETRLNDIAGQLRERLGIAVDVELLDKRTTLGDDSLCYRQANVIISAVSTPYILDVDKVAPGTLLIDDSQPYCWDRDAAWARFQRTNDILPCDAGLVDAGSIGFVSHFPFDFSDDQGFGSAISWSCLAEGLLRGIDSSLPNNIGELEVANLLAYESAFLRHGFTIPQLQCGLHAIPERTQSIHPSLVEP